MTTQIITTTESFIDNAVKSHDVSVLEKETIFVLNNFVLNLSEAYPDVFDFVKPTHVQLKTEPQFALGDKYVSMLKQMLNYSERIFHERNNLAQIKMSFDSWFYEITNQGILVYGYNPGTLLNMSEASKRLGVSRTMLYKYIRSGLEVVGEKGSQKVPQFVVDAWKDPLLAFQMQWIAQIKRARSMSIHEKIDAINTKIHEFELQYKGTFHHLFGQYTDDEIDGMNEAVDITDWKELEEQKIRYLEHLKSVDNNVNRLSHD